jgi:hypothetical protein
MEDPMPEVPPDYEDFLPVEERDDHFVTVQMPRSALRSMQRDAKAYRRHVEQQGGQAAVDNVNAGLDPEGGVILEPGEDGQTLERRANFTGSPPDQPQPGDPYDEAGRIMERIEQGGGKHVEAWAGALNHLANAAARGDARVILRDRRQQYHGEGG